MPLQGWTMDPLGNPYLITTSLAAASNLVVNFPCTTQYMPLTISADVYPQTGCSVTQFELNLCAGTGNTDTYDISLVNGFNYPGEIKPDSGNPLMACCQTGNSTNPGVYPYSCDICTAASAPPCTGPPGECKAGTQYNPDPPCNYNIPSTNYTVYIGGTPDVPTPSPVWCPTSCPTSTQACTLGAQCNTP